MKALHIYSSGENMKEKIRLKKTVSLKEDEKTEMSVINVYPELENQRIIGFGGAFTGSTCHCISAMSKKNQDLIINSLFSKDAGNAYNFCRTTIHSSDFAPKNYTYLPKGAKTLDGFSLERDDEEIFPIIRKALDLAGDSLILFASPWSPPSFMKTNSHMMLGGKLKPEYAEMWADYFVKYIEECRKRGIKISAVSAQNEPNAIQTWESCQYTAAQEAEFVHKHLYPALKTAGLDVKIIIWDHNKERVYERPRDIFAEYDSIRDEVWGIGFHWYSGTHFDNVRLAHNAFPEKALILTEFCKEDNSNDRTVTPKDACDYLQELIGDMNAGTSAFCDWNMVLDTKGGPYHNRLGGCKAGIYVDKDKDSVTFTPIYNAVAHMSRFISRDSVCISASSYDPNIVVCAAKNPDGGIVTVILNNNAEKSKCVLKIGGYSAGVTVAPMSAVTLVAE